MIVHQAPKVWYEPVTHGSCRTIDPPQDDTETIDAQGYRKLVAREKPIES